MKSKSGKSKDRYDLSPSQLVDVIDLLRSIDEALKEIKEFDKRFASKMTTKDAKAFLSQSLESLAKDYYKKICSRIKYLGKKNERRYDTTDPVSYLISHFEEPRSKRGAFYRSVLKNLKEFVEHFLECEAEYRAKNKKK